MCWFADCVFSISHAVYEIMWKSTVDPDRPQMAIWRMRIACWIPKTINTHSEYVTLTAFPLQQQLHNAPQCYVCMYIACHVGFKQEI